MKRTITLKQAIQKTQQRWINHVNKVYSSEDHDECAFCEYSLCERCEDCPVVIVLNRSCLNSPEYYKWISTRSAKSAQGVLNLVNDIAKHYHIKQVWAEEDTR